MMTPREPSDLASFYEPPGIDPAQYENEAMEKIEERAEKEARECAEIFVDWAVNSFDAGDLARIAGAGVAEHLFGHYGEYGQEQFHTLIGRMLKDYTDYRADLAHGNGEWAEIVRSLAEDE